MKIQKFIDFPLRSTEIRSAVYQIFFQSTESDRRQKTTEQNNEFYDKWTAFYWAHALEDIFFAEADDGTIVGYLMGFRDSREALSFYEIINPSYTLFKDQFARFPAHLHINLDPGHRKLGIGSNLLQRYLDELRQHKIAGVHIVTTPTSANVPFYQRNGFSERLERPWKNMPLLFLGHAIS